MPKRCTKYTCKLLLMSQTGKQIVLIVRPYERQDDRLTDRQTNRQEDSQIGTDRQSRAAKFLAKRINFYARQRNITSNSHAVPPVPKSAASPAPHRLSEYPSNIATFSAFLHIIKFQFPVVA